MHRKQPKLIALALAGIVTLAGLAGCAGGEGANNPSSVPTRSPVDTESPDPTATVSVASAAKAQVAPEPTPATQTTPTPTPTTQTLTESEYLTWCSVNTSNDTSGRVLGIDPNDFGDVSTITNGDMILALEVHIDVVDAVEPPESIEKFHTAQRHWFEGLIEYYGRFPQNEYVDWWALEQDLLEDAELSWRLLTVSTAIENLPASIRTQIVNNCLNQA